MTDTRTNELSPGFMVIHSNQPDALRALLVTWMNRYPLRPLENEVVLVQSNGIAQWLKLALARDVGEGGCGIAAALDAQLPSRFIWQAYRAVLGDDAVPHVSPFDKSLLIWRLMRLLPALLDEDSFVPLRRFLARDDDLRKRYQLSERLADLLDQYQVYRADWLADWARGEDTIVTSRSGRQTIPDTLLWQPRLWRALLDDVGADQADGSRAGVHRRFMERVAAMTSAAASGAALTRPVGLPRRVLVFGISSMPQQALQVLSALANWTQVLMCVHNPSEHYWANIIADKDLLRAERLRQTRKPGTPEQIDDAQLHLYSHPLLAAWGKQGRDFIGLLDVHDERERYEQRFVEISQRIDLFEPNGDDTLLQQLQEDIRELRPLTETREQWPPLMRAENGGLAFDDSIRFHVAHSAQREVEILHDQLLAALSDDPSLRPRDIIVMVPDISLYAPHIQAVFGLLDYSDPRYIPFRVADQGQRHHDPLLGALEKLLALPQSRLAVSDLLDLLEVPALRRRFDIDESDLPLLHRWISAANIRWGLHAEQRQSLDLPGALEQNSWFFGLRRMLLGYAVGAANPSTIDGQTGAEGGGDTDSHAAQAWQSIEPLDEIGGLDAVLLGPLVRVIESLDTYWRLLRESASPAEWGERLQALTGAFFLADDGPDGFTMLRLDNALQEWVGACADGGLTQLLPLSVVREHWLQQLDQPGLSQPFFGGAVTFATLMPMRAIPFRRLCLLGMNDGDYPRARVPMDFDLMARDYRPGDRSRREDDRYLFLEALLSAREHLHISWIGSSIHDNTERPPSVLVAQLRDHIAAGWRLDDDDTPDGGRSDALLAALTVTHRLQPFNRDYFSDAGDPRLFSFAREWRAGLLPEGEIEGAASNDAAPALPPFAWEGELTLRQLSDFLRDPVRAFMRQRLKVHFETVDPVSEDQEPFALDALDNWRLQDELIRAQLAAVDAGQSREGALAAQLDRIARRGDLPAAHFASAVRERLAEPMDKLFIEYDAALAQWPQTIADIAIRDVYPTSAASSSSAATSAAQATSTASALSSLQLSDWLSGLRCNAAGERARVLLDTGSLVKKGVYRRDKVIPFWIAHLAGHLAGTPMTTVIVSKAGTVTLPPLPIDEARAYWWALLDAWRDGMTRPLPLAVKTAFVWLEKGGSTLVDTADGDATQEGELPPASKAAEAARASYEINDPIYGRISEVHSNPYLARVFPDFNRLWSSGEFARVTDRLLGPIFEHVGKRGAAKGARA